MPAWDYKVQTLKLLNWKLAKYLATQPYSTRA
uniref:Uncharacterized protein n=1 Tax=Arundo donax TaxID=35708 RepID=A0A0A9E881_ARUDO